MAVQPIPEGYQSVIPYLVVENPDKVIAFLQKTFDAKQTERVLRPDGGVGHAQVTIGDCVVMLGGAGGDHKPMQNGLYVYVPDTDAVYKRALAAGATSIMEPADQFYGDRTAGVKDFAGNIWWIGTHKEDVSPQEMQRRAAKSMHK